MKQLFQSLKTGETEILELPVPQLKPFDVLIKTNLTLISAGTERMIVDFGKSNILEKAKQQPEKLNEVFQKVNTEGPLVTFKAVQNKLEKPIPLGYSNVGTVIKVGKNVTSFKSGDRVLSNGPHSEVVLVPHHLVAKIPDEVEDSDAVFTVLASIGLQGIRLSKPTLGEVFLVNGLGLIGLLTAQLLLQNGVKVLGFDTDKEKCKLARNLGIDALQLTKDSDPIAWCKNKTSGNDVDAVIITASTKSNDPIDISAKVCRKRGRIVLIGSIGLNIKRDLFYKKELTFQVSCSYGPGRYEKSYEDKGIDYPIGFVRWTEQRNFQAILEIFRSGNIKTKNLISYQFDFTNASKAYAILTENKQALGILLKFRPDKINLKKTLIISEKEKSIQRLDNKPIIGFIGAGNYSSQILLPILKKLRANIEIIGALTGENSIYLAKKFSIKKVTTDINALINDPQYNTLIIATRHDSHGTLVEKALKAGKNIFVEKPLCLSSKELIRIRKLYDPRKILMVGYNRRFSPLIQELKEKLDNLKVPKLFVYTCNAGHISKNHWTQDSQIGGGRLVGECCHFLDLLRFLSNSKIVNFSLTSIPDNLISSDSFTFTINFNDGSIGTIHYFTNGHKSFPKERIEVFASGKVYRIDNFKKLEIWGEKNFKVSRKFNTKGQYECMSKFLMSIEKGGSDLIDLNEIFEVQKILLEALGK